MRYGMSWHYSHNKNAASPQMEESHAELSIFTSAEIAFDLHIIFNSAWV